MTARLVCVPLTRAELAELLDRGLPGERAGFTATTELIDMFDLAADEEEDAEYAALLVASVWALTRTGERVVASVQAETQPESDDELRANGGVRVQELTPLQVVAWFADDPGTDLSAAATAASGLGLEAAWDLPEVAKLLIDADLLWHSPTERA